MRDARASARAAIADAANREIKIIRALDGVEFARATATNASNRNETNRTTTTRATTTTMRDDDRTYDAAVRELAKTITGKKRADPGALTWEAQFAQLETYVSRLDLRGRVDALDVVHVAGTKGKGSTCAMVEGMLRASGTRVGTFTSPHLMDVRERFRIDGAMVDEETFAREFWWTRDAIAARCGDCLLYTSPSPRDMRRSRMPSSA